MAFARQCPPTTMTEAALMKHTLLTSWHHHLPDTAVAAVCHPTAAKSDVRARTFLPPTAPLGRLVASVCSKRPYDRHAGHAGSERDSGSGKVDALVVEHCGLPSVEMRTVALLHLCGPSLPINKKNICLFNNKTIHSYTDSPSSDQPFSCPSLL